MYYSQEEIDALAAEHCAPWVLDLARSYEGGDPFDVFNAAADVHIGKGESAFDELTDFLCCLRFLGKDKLYTNKHAA